MEAARSKLLLEKFFNDNCSQEELSDLLDAIKNSNLDTNEFDGILEKVLAKQDLAFKISKDKSSEIITKILKSEYEEPKVRKLRPVWIFKVAAAFVGILIVSLIVYNIYKGFSYSTSQTAFGQTRDIVLPDGSKVILNANSIITYKKNWKNNENREVELIGEAFFEVTHKKNSQKFIVKTSNLKVEVLGTKFNVLSRKSRSMVLLNSGKVKLNVKNQQGFIMKPGEMVELSSNTKAIRKSYVNPKQYISWKDRILTFESTSIKEIASMIEDTYGLKIVIKNRKISDEKFTGTFPVDEDINLLLKMLSKANKFKLIEKDGYIIFQ